MTRFEDRPRGAPSDARGRVVEKRRILVIISGAPAAVEKKRFARRLLLVATTAHRFGGQPRDLRQGGPEATTRDPRDGSGRAGAIALMTVRDATIECTSPEAKSDSRKSGIAATTKKLRVINKSLGASKSPDAVQPRRRF